MGVQGPFQWKPPCRTGLRSLPEQDPAIREPLTGPPEPV